MIESRDLFAGLHRHRALVDDDAITGQNAGDLARDLFDEAEIDAAIRLLRSRHGDEDDLRVIDAILDAAGEAQPLRGDIAVNDFLEARLVDRHLAGLERFDFARIVIDADDVVADVGEASARDETDITGTDDGDIHGEKM